MDALLAIAFLGLVHFHADVWNLELVGGLLALGVAVTIFAYVYFMFKDPSELHSENYLIRSRELAIRGDNLAGPKEQLLPNYPNSDGGLIGRK
ncbi:MAG: hypothetical protein ACREVO_00740 [Steroidobacteraceae bacterium]